MRKTLLTVCLLALPLAPAMDAQAQGTPPAATRAELGPAARQIRAFYDVLLDSMKRANELGIMGRYKKLEPAVDAAFDLPTMTERMVGPTWASMSQAERDRLISGVRRMSIAGYAQSFDGYSGESFSVDPTVRQRGNEQLVSTEMTVPGKEAVSFIYRLHNSGGTWRIIDIYLDGSISQVAFRRSDFASTLKSGGAAALARKLDELAEKMLKPAS